MPYAWHLYSVSRQQATLWYDEGDAFCSSSRVSTQTLAEGSESECMWHFNVHVTLHSAMRITVRNGPKKKLFALQRRLPPCDLWIFYCSSKPYFTVWSSWAATGTHWSLWYWASNPRHWEAAAGRLLYDLCKAKIFWYWHCSFIRETECWLKAIRIQTLHWSFLIWIDGTFI